MGNEYQVQLLFLYNLAQRGFTTFQLQWNGGFFMINVNAILTLKLSPHVGHFDQGQLQEWTERCLTAVLQI